MKKTIKILFLTGAICLFSAFGVSCSKTDEDAGFDNVIYRPNGFADTVYVIRASDMSDAEYAMVQSMQGILAQDKATIFIEDLDGEGESGQSKVWLDEAVRDQGIRTEYVTDPWTIVEQFADALQEKKYVLYDSVETSGNMFNLSVNHAATVAGVERFLMIDSSLEQAARSRGFVLGKDVRTLTTRDILDAYKNELDSSFLIHQNPGRRELRDYGIAGKALCYYGDFETDTRIVQSILEWADENAPIYGWTESETNFVNTASLMSKVVVAADWCSNLSFYAALPRDGVIEQSHSEQRKIRGEAGKHYVAIVMSDGDNIQWLQRNFFSNKQYFASPHRGEFKMTWGISPTLYDISPNVMQKAYALSTANDEFIAGPGGFGYVNIADYNPSSLESYAALTSSYMKKSDLQYVNLIDAHVNAQALKAFGKQNAISGGVWSVGDKYVEEQGGVYWANDKPFITARETLWRVTGSESDNRYYGFNERVAQRINAYKTDYTCIEGYTVVVAHAWSIGMMDSIARFVEMLDDHVELVSVGEMVEMVKEYVPHKDVAVLNDATLSDFENNLAPIGSEQLIWNSVRDLPETENTVFTFTSENDIGGFVLDCGGLEYDKAVFSNEYGGSILLEGSDIGDTLDPLPNAWMYRMLRLPQDAKYLSIRALPGDNTYFRIRFLYEEDGELKKVVLQDGFGGEVDAHGYHLLQSAGTFYFDVSAYAGKKVLLTLEQDDNGEGSGEMVYVKKIAFTDEISESESSYPNWDGYAILTEWAHSGTVENHREGFCLTAKDGPSSISYTFTVTPQTAWVKFYVRMFVRVDQAPDIAPTLQCKVGENVISALDSSADTVTLPGNSDNYYCLAYDLSAYIGQEVTVTFYSLSGEHATIGRILLAESCNVDEVTRTYSEKYIQNLAG